MTQRPAHRQKDDRRRPAVARKGGAGVRREVTAAGTVGVPLAAHGSVAVARGGRMLAGGTGRHGVSTLPVPTNVANSSPPLTSDADVTACLTHSAATEPDTALGGCPDGDELDDLQADPREPTNLAGDPRYQVVVGELRLQLLDWALATETSRPVPLHFRPFRVAADHTHPSPAVAYPDEQ